MDTPRTLWDEVRDELTNPLHREKISTLIAFGCLLTMVRICDRIYYEYNTRLTPIIRSSGQEPLISFIDRYGLDDREEGGTVARRPRPEHIPRPTPTVHLTRASSFDSYLPADIGRIDVGEADDIREEEARLRDYDPDKYLPESHNSRMGYVAVMLNLISRYIPKPVPSVRRSKYDPPIAAAERAFRRSWANFLARADELHYSLGMYMDTVDDRPTHSLEEARLAQLREAINRFGGWITEKRVELGIEREGPVVEVRSLHRSQTVWEVARQVLPANLIDQRHKLASDITHLLRRRIFTGGVEVAPDALFPIAEICEHMGELRELLVTDQRRKSVPGEEPRYDDNKYRAVMRVSNTMIDLIGCDYESVPEDPVTFATSSARLGGGYPPSVFE